MAKTTTPAVNIPTEGNHWTEFESQGKVFKSVPGTEWETQSVNESVSTRLV